MNKIKITFIYEDKKYECLANEGESILQVAHKNNIPLEGACEGSLACSTCHVVVDKKDFCNKLCEKSIEEEDMLDLAFGLEQTSRLGCQIKVDKSMENATFYIPSESRNFKG